MQDRVREYKTLDTEEKVWHWNRVLLDWFLKGLVSWRKKSRVDDKVNQGRVGHFTLVSFQRHFIASSVNFACPSLSAGGIWSMTEEDCRMSTMSTAKESFLSQFSRILSMRMLSAFRSWGPNSSFVRLSSSSLCKSSSMSKLRGSWVRAAMKIITKKQTKQKRSWNCKNHRTQKTKTFFWLPIASVALEKIPTSTLTICLHKRATFASWEFWMEAAKTRRSCSVIPETIESMRWMTASICWEMNCSSDLRASMLGKKKKKRKKKRWEGFQQETQELRQQRGALTSG